MKNCTRYLVSFRWYCIFLILLFSKYINRAMNSTRAIFWFKIMLMIKKSTWRVLVDGRGNRLKWEIYMVQCWLMVQGAVGCITRYGEILLWCFDDDKKKENRKNGRYCGAKRTRHRKKKTFTVMKLLLNSCHYARFSLTPTSPCLPRLLPQFSCAGDGFYTTFFLFYEKIWAVSLRKNAVQNTDSRDVF